MTEAVRLALRSVTRRWRRNLISLVVVAAGVAAIVIPSSISVASSEAVSSRLDDATRSRLTVLLPQAFWKTREESLLASIRADPRVAYAGTLVAPDRTAGSAEVSTVRGARVVETTVGIATPSGLRAVATRTESGGLGADDTVSSLSDAVYLGARVARELDYPAVGAGPVLVNGRPFEVLGIIASEEAWISASIVFPPGSAETAGLLPANRVVTVATRQDVSGRFQRWIAFTLSPLAPSDVTVLNPPDAQKLRAEILARGTSLTGLVALIATLTALLTLAATTFASLTERRREMGLYLALGYGRAFVSGQIVVEGTVVGMMGGVVGFLVGTCIAAAVAALSFPLFYLPSALLVLPLAAGCLGMLSALVPAWVATRVAPSELLRD